MAEPISPALQLNMPPPYMPVTIYSPTESMIAVIAAEFV